MYQLSILIPMTTARECSYRDESTHLLVSMYMRNLLSSWAGVSHLIPALLVSVIESKGPAGCGRERSQSGLLFCPLISPPLMLEESQEQALKFLTFVSSQSMFPAATLVLGDLSHPSQTYIPVRVSWL